MNDVLTTEELYDDGDREGAVRPASLAEFQGQQDIKSNLSLFIRAAKERGETLDHVFISGPPGLGKTTLASIIAEEMGVNLIITGAPALDKPKDLAGLLTALNEGSVFFIDEIHRLRPAIEEMLYVAMEDFELDFVVGQGAGARAIRIPIPKFTLAGATTKPGRVASPLHTRFGISVRIDYYPPEELTAIILRSAEIYNIRIHPEAARTLAGSSRGTPRMANRLLRRMRDFAQDVGSPIITADIVREALTRLGVDSEGLEEHDRVILRTIVERYAGGPVGVETLALAVGESVDSLEDYYEPYLVRQGFLQRTPRGREATEKAFLHLGLTAQPKARQRKLF